MAANLVFDQICSQVFDKFVRVCDTLSTSFRLSLSKTWSRTAAGSLVRALARQMEFRKKPVLSKFAAGFRHAFDLLATRFSTKFAAD